MFLGGKMHDISSCKKKNLTKSLNHFKLFQLLYRIAMSLNVFLRSPHLHLFDQNIDIFIQNV